MARDWRSTAVEFAVLDRRVAGLAGFHSNGKSLAVPTAAQPDPRINLLPGDNRDLLGRAGLLPSLSTVIW
jgi:hypothetical protein